MALLISRFIYLSSTWHFIYLLKQILSPMWGLNSRPQDQELPALPTEPARHPSTGPFKYMSQCELSSFLLCSDAKSRNGGIILECFLSALSPLKNHQALLIGLPKSLQSVHSFPHSMPLLYLFPLGVLWTSLLTTGTAFPVPSLLTPQVKLSFTNTNVIRSLPCLKRFSGFHCPLDEAQIP